LRKKNPEIKFLLENVKMKQKWKDIISDLLGVQPIFINSADFSAQNRQRLYWTNIPVDEWTPCNDVLQDVLEDSVTDREKSHCIDANYFKGGNLKSYFEKHRRQLVFNRCLQVGEADIKGRDSLKRVYSPEGKGPALTTCGGGHREPKVYVPPLQWRKLTPLECERLQTVPERYTKCGQKENGDIVEISNTQRYKMLGNGFTVNVIAHIIKNL
jgi:site-specific DNA-cytosine methylase